MLRSMERNKLGTRILLGVFVGMIGIGMLLYLVPGGAGTDAAGADVVGFAYDAAGNELTKDDANGVTTTNTYTPLDQLASDAKSGKLAKYIWISPDVCKDMHGMPEEPCPYAKDVDLRRSGDDFVKQWVPVLMHSTSWTSHSVIFILTDETTYTGNPATGGWLNADGCCDAPALPPGTMLLPKGGTYGGGLIPFIAVGGIVKRGYVSHFDYNHYALLRTIEDAWGLDRLGFTSDTENIRSLADLFITRL